MYTFVPLSDLIKKSWKTPQSDNNEAYANSCAPNDRILSLWVYRIKNRTEYQSHTSHVQNSSVLWRPFVYESHFACFNVVNQSSQSDQFCSITARYEVCRKRSGRPDINNPDGEIITYRTSIINNPPCYL